MNSLSINSSRIKQYLPFITYFLFYLLIVYFLKFKNQNFSITGESKYFFEVENFKYDLSLAPIIFIFKFLYISFFIFTGFNIQKISIPFAKLLNWVILSSLIYYLPILINTIQYYDLLHILNYGDLKDISEFSILRFIHTPSITENKFLSTLISEVNVFNIFFLLLLGLFINKNVQSPKPTIFSTVFLSTIVGALLINGVILILISL